MAREWYTEQTVEIPELFVLGTVFKGSKVGFLAGIFSRGSGKRLCTDSGKRPVLSSTFRKHNDVTNVGLCCQTGSTRLRVKMGHGYPTTQLEGKV